MSNNLEYLQQELRELLGEDADVSHLTPELVEEAINAVSPEVALPRVNWVTEGNSITPISGGHKWRRDCSLTEWVQWTNGPISATRIVNCTSGILRYRITG
jgi:hypothetical protein